MLHAAANFIVATAFKNGAALALEDLEDIRKMYRKGNGKGRDYTFRLNSWPHGKIGRMLEYKAAWKGITMVPLTKSETYGSSSECASCGEKLHRPAREDAEHGRMLWCQTCRMWTDRDVNAALNLSARGRLRFDRSLPEPQDRSQQAGLVVMEKGEAGEAVKGNGTRTLILRVDASKALTRG